jgi:hypothetical protein
MTPRRAIAEIKDIESRLLFIRGDWVIIDDDLAELYGVSTGRLNECVERQRERFPEDLAFRLTSEETSEAIACSDRLTRLRQSKSRPYVFTEHGATMAASVLQSDRAVEMSTFLVRAFVRVRQMPADCRELAQRISQLERRLASHDQHIKTLAGILRQLIGSDPLSDERRTGSVADGCPSGECH